MGILLVYDVTDERSFNSQLLHLSPNFTCINPRPRQTFGLGMRM